MIYIVQNLGPILAATLAGLLAGGIVWSLAGGASPIRLRLLATALLAEAWLCAILAGALILAPVRAGGWTVALGSAVIIWIGFVAPATLVTTAYRGGGARAATVDCLHWLAVMLAQAAVLHAIGLVRP